MKVVIYLGIIMTAIGVVAHITAYVADKIYRKKSLEKSIEKKDS